MAMSCDEIWQMQDSVRTVTEACLGCGVVYDLRWDVQGRCLRMTLNRHLSEEETYDLLSQFYFTADYDGDSPMGTCFVIYP